MRDGRIHPSVDEVAVFGNLDRTVRRRGPVDILDIVEMINAHKCFDVFVGFLLVVAYPGRIYLTHVPFLLLQISFGIVT